MYSQDDVGHNCVEILDSKLPIQVFSEDRTALNRCQEAIVKFYVRVIPTRALTQWHHWDIPNQCNEPEGMPCEDARWHLDEVATVAMQLEVMEVNDVGGDGIQEIPVVTNDH